MIFSESQNIKISRSKNMGTCAVTTSFLGCIVTSYLFFRYTWYLDLGTAQKYLVLRFPAQTPQN